MADLLTRTFPVTLTPAGEPDGRVVSGRCVPYGVPSLVQDPGTEPYWEVFARGAFTRAVKNPDRVQFKFNHGAGLADWIGRAMAFTDADEGLEADFRVIRGAFGDQALTLVDEGLLTGLSIGFVPLGARVKKTPEGAIIRDRCHLAEVSLTPEPAYPGALVTARRSRPPLELQRETRDAALDERLRAIGVRL